MRRRQKNRIVGNEEDPFWKWTLDLYNPAVTEGALRNYPDLVAALFFCICGDLFLAWSGELKRTRKEPLFTLGVAAFGTAHIFLILYFGFRPRAALIAAVLIVLLRVAEKCCGIAPGEYTIRTGIYSIIVSFMLASAVDTAFFPAAFLFWISDGLLGLWYFRSGAPFWIGGIALILYYRSLFLLA